MANKVKFNECLSVIPDALIWAEDQDVEGLKNSSLRMRKSHFIALPVVVL